MSSLILKSLCNHESLWVFITTNFCFKVIITDDVITRSYKYQRERERKRAWKHERYVYKLTNNYINEIKCKFSRLTITVQILRGEKKVSFFKVKGYTYLYHPPTTRVPKRYFIYIYSFEYMLKELRLSTCRHQIYNEFIHVYSMEQMYSPFWVCTRTGTHGYVY